MTAVALFTPLLVLALVMALPTVEQWALREPADGRRADRRLRRSDTAERPVPQAGGGRA